MPVLRRPKALFYIRLLLCMATASRARLTLTSLGIFVAVIIFSVGNILMDSYYAAQLEIINQMEADTCIITSAEDPVTLRETLASFGGEHPLEVRSGTTETSILSTKIDDQRYLTVLAALQGISPGASVLPVRSEDGRELPMSYGVVRGRFITDSDIRNVAQVVVIDEFTESLLFPQGDGLGQYIMLDQPIGNTMIVESSPDYSNASSQESADAVQGNPLQVVGIIRENYVATLSKTMFRGRLNGSSTDNIAVKTTLYCPISLIDRMREEIDDAFISAQGISPELSALFSTKVSTTYIYSFASHDKYALFFEKASLLAEINARRGVSMQITSKETYLVQAKRMLEPMRTALAGASLVLSAFAAISIMSIVFFSIKERIPEIGIRKAFGASRIDILAQFIFEVAVIALPVSVLSVAVSYGFCLLIKDYLVNTMFVPFIIWAPLEHLLLPIFLGVLVALVCSIIPSVYASSIKVTDSLRFD